MESVDDNYSVERRSYRAVEDCDFDHLFDCVLPSIIVGNGSVEVNNERDAWFSFCRQTKAPCLHLREEGATAIIRGTTSCNKFSFCSWRNCKMSNFYTATTFFLVAALLIFSSISDLCTWTVLLTITHLWQINQVCWFI